MARLRRPRGVFAVSALLSLALCVAAFASLAPAQTSDDSASVAELLAPSPTQNRPYPARRLTCDYLALPAIHLTPDGELVTSDNDGLRGDRRLPVLLGAVPIEGRVLENEYDFFQVCLEPTNDTLRVEVVVDNLDGNPDLYVSFRNPFPSVATSDFLSAKLGNEAIRFNTDLGVVQEALGNDDGSEKGNTAPLVPRVVHISVFGRVDSAYRISLVVSSPPTLTKATKPRRHGSLRPSSSSVVQKLSLQ